MADFRIDELELNWIATGKYSLLIRTNTDKPAGDDEVPGTVTGQELIFYPGGVSGNKRVTFKCDEIVFTGYRKQQYLLISIFDNDTTPALKRRKGGVVIADTAYPPPGGVKDVFSSKFIIKKLLVKRVGLTNTFTVEMRFSHDTAMCEYTQNMFEFRADTENNDQRILVYNFNENAANAASIPVYCYAYNVTFGAYPDILPFFVVKNPTAWEDVDTKKGMMFIE